MHFIGPKCLETHMHKHAHRILYKKIHGRNHQTPVLRKEEARPGSKGTGKDRLRRAG